MTRNLQGTNGIKDVHKSYLFTVLNAKGPGEHSRYVTTFPPRILPEFNVSHYFPSQIKYYIWKTL